MKKMREHKGITLLALVITIVILIILATITINTTFGDSGIIKKAEEAVALQANSQIQEDEFMNETAEYIDSILNENDKEDDEPVTEREKIKDAKESGKIFEETTILIDEEGNEVKIPKGNKIATDSGIRVEEGIVIEDKNQNQMVWIPVGKYKTTTGEKENLLARRTFSKDGATILNANEYIETEIPASTTGDSTVKVKVYGEENENSVAHDDFLEFKEHVKTGFYIGRYECGSYEARTQESEVDPDELCVIYGKYTYNFITRDEAISICNLSVDGSHIQLISSYAWDTALNFICQNNTYELAITTDSQYGNLGTNKSNKLGISENDSYCNIHDMLGNLIEWTTEYCVADNGQDYSCVLRGGNCYDNLTFASIRLGVDKSYEAISIGARVQMYVE